jgi:hypothetical protein
VRTPKDFADMVRSHYDPEESRLQGRRVFSDYLDGNGSWVALYSLEQFAQRFGVNPDEIELFLPPMQGPIH